MKNLISTKIDDLIKIKNEIVFFFPNKKKLLHYSNLQLQFIDHLFQSFSFINSYISNLQNYIFKTNTFRKFLFLQMISRNDTIKHPTDFSNLPTLPPFNKLQLDAPVVLQRQEQDTRQIGSPFVRDSRLANELRERRVPSERDQQATGALQPAQVSPVCGGDPRHPAQVTLHPAPLVADLLGNLEQLVEVLEQYQVIGGGEDVPPLG